MSDYFYFYTGAVFTKYSGAFVPPPNRKLFGILHLSNRLPPNVQNYFVTDWIAYSFSDGVDRFSSSDTTAISSFQVSTDGSSKITTWNFFVGYWDENSQAGSTNPSNQGVYDNADGPIPVADWAYSTSRGSWLDAAERPSSVRRPFELRT